MLTLKVVTTDLMGQTRTELFSGDAISHKEYSTEDHFVVSKVCKINPSVWIIGIIEENSSTQKFAFS